MKNPRRNHSSTDLVDPLDASRHPFETYLLSLAAVSGIPLLFGEPNSASIEATLPPLLVNGWGAMLMLGSLLALTGLYWRGRSITGLVLERAGLVGVGGASLVYGAATMIAAGGWSGLFATCVVGGFGLACFAQARRISVRITLVLHAVASDG